MQPVMFSHVEARRGRPYWFRSGDDVCYYRNVYRNQSGGGGNTHMTCTFTQVFPHEGDCCYLAYHYPYTYSKLIVSLIDFLYFFILYFFNNCLYQMYIFVTTVYLQFPPILKKNFFVFF